MDKRRDDVTADVDGRRQSQKPFGFDTPGFKLILGGLKIVKSAYGALKEGLASFGGPQLSCRALQKRHAEVLFQRRYLRAYSGIGYAEKFSRLAKASRLNDFDENCDAVEIHSSRSYIRLNSVSKFSRLVRATSAVYL